MTNKLSAPKLSLRDGWKQYFLRNVISPAFEKSILSIKNPVCQDRIGVKFLKILLLCTMLSSCACVTRGIQKLGNTSNRNYPTATAMNPKLEKPAIVNLSA